MNQKEIHAAYSTDGNVFFLIISDLKNTTVTNNCDPDGYLETLLQSWISSTLMLWAILTG